MTTDIILLLAGMLVGAMNAIAGGGMLLGFPILLAVGVPPLVANATTGVITLPGLMTAVYGYRSYVRKLPRAYLWLLLPCAIGGAIGAYILSHTPADNFEKLLPGLILFAVLLFAFQPLMHFHLHRHLRGKKKSSRTLLWIGLGVLLTATYGGYFSTGLGFIILAFLGFTSLHDAHKMNVLKNIACSMIGITSLLVLLSTGLIDWRHGLVMAAGTAIGGYVGARLAQKVSSHSIRIIVIVFGLAAATYLALRTY